MAQYKTPMNRDQVFESAMRSFKAFLYDQTRIKPRQGGLISPLSL